MNDIPASQGAQPKMRDALIDAILFRIEQELEDAIPSDFTEETRDAILAEVVPNSKFILASLGTAELQNDSALDRHIRGVLATTTYLVHRVQEQRQRHEQRNRS